ncbi:MAG TPA: sodium:solute symporter [Vicinamibacterales bacterium]|nr:sodium:solute symporter [Vicinamibacterales bacterium]
MAAARVRLTMHTIDWVVVIAFIAWILYDGIRRTRDSQHLEGYFLASRSIPWWAAGLSVMATQLSAITMIGTTGQGYMDGMRFIQFYFALPLAMIVLSLTLVPFFYKSGVYTAYEYLEKRFDAKTRSLTSLLFLISRGMAVGAAVSAPAVVLSLVLGWDLTATSLAITAPAVVYTMIGGVQAVTWTDVKIMVLVVFGLFAVIAAAILGLPDSVSVTDGLSVAAAAGRLRSFDFSFDLSNTYTFWSGTIAAFFLFCSYFGTDQSQVQRYLTARSVDEARSSLLMSGYWKIPLQVVVLLLGVSVYAFYVFNPSPLLFNRTHEDLMKGSKQAPEYAALERRFEEVSASRAAAAAGMVRAENAGDQAFQELARREFTARETQLREIHDDALGLVREATGDPVYNDVNYVIPTFILTQLPVGLVGLLIVAIILAATDTIAGELNSLSTATVIDFYRRWFRKEGTDAHYLRVSKLVTGLWGIFACVVAVWAAQLGSLIEVVNRFGSYFYGSILGVFILAIAFPMATPTGAFVGLIAGMTCVGLAANFTDVAFLWHNVTGAVAVVVIGLLVSLFTQPRRSDAGVRTA